MKIKKDSDGMPRTVHECEECKPQSTPNPHPKGHMDNCSCVWCKPSITCRHDAPLQDGKCPIYLNTGIPQHTATPWIVGRYAAKKLIAPMGVVGIGNGIASIARTLHTGIVSQKEAEANAAFIVRAVNCHDEIVSMLKELSECGDFEFVNEPLRRRVDKLIAKAEAVQS